MCPRASDEDKTNEQDEASDNLVWTSGDERHVPSLLLSRSWIRWLLLLSVSGVLAVERRRQRNLTHLPLVFRQMTDKNEALCSLLSAVLLRSIRPSLFSGIRSSLNSVLGLVRHPGQNDNAPDNNNQRCREIINIPNNDGAYSIAVDWEFPSGFTASFDEENKIELPVVLILPGSNTNSRSGYVRSIMRTYTKNGWIAAAMNHRECKEVIISSKCSNNDERTDTDDLRTIIAKISLRLAPSSPLFLIGFSLGSNILVKYLGEESMTLTLPKCIVGAVSVSSPRERGPDNLKSNWARTLKVHGSPTAFLKHYFQETIQKALFIRSSLDNTISQTRQRIIRTDSTRNWLTNSCNYVALVSIPLLEIIAEDDSLLSDTAETSLRQYLSNPNVLFIKTKPGDHHLASGNNPFGSFDPMWIENVSSKFYEMLLKLPYDKDNSGRVKCHAHDDTFHPEGIEDTLFSGPRSRL